MRGVGVPLVRPLAAVGGHRCGDHGNGPRPVQADRLFTASNFLRIFYFYRQFDAAGVHWRIRDSVLGSAAGTYITGILASQFISNVPAAMLMAAFTEQRKALLLGVNIGGLGTLIASMASVISYKLFAEAHPAQIRQYLLLFLYYNAIGLLLLVPAVYFLLLY